MATADAFTGGWWQHLPDQTVVDAMVRANGDRDRLARLVRSGRVRRDGPATALSADVARRAAALAHEGINLAIRPKKKAKKRRY